MARRRRAGSRSARRSAPASGRPGTGGAARATVGGEPPQARPSRPPGRRSRPPAAGRDRVATRRAVCGGGVGLEVERGPWRARRRPARRPRSGAASRAGRTRPPARPSISQMSHSGRLRSSGYDISAAQSSSSWSSSPGSGSAAWCTCVGDVEVGVVHPHGRRLPDQGEADALAQLRHQVQAALHLVPQLVEPQAARASCNGPPSKIPMEPMCMGVCARLHGQEGRIERRQELGAASWAPRPMGGRSRPPQSHPRCSRRASGCRGRLRRLP